MVFLQEPVENFQVKLAFLKMFCDFEAEISIILL